MTIGHGVGHALDVLGPVEVGVVLGGGHGAHRRPPAHPDADAQNGRGRGDPQSDRRPPMPARTQGDDGARPAVNGPAPSSGFGGRGSGWLGISWLRVSGRGLIRRVLGNRGFGRPGFGQLRINRHDCDQPRSGAPGPRWFPHLRLVRDTLEQFGAQRGGRIDRLQRRPEPGEGLVESALSRTAVRQAAVRRDGVGGLPRPVAPLEIRHDSAPISLRSRAIPFLILVLTVPSGTPVRRAISVWVRPVK